MVSTFENEGFYYKWLYWLYVPCSKSELFLGLAIGSCWYVTLTRRWKANRPENGINFFEGLINLSELSRKRVLNRRIENHQFWRAQWVSLTGQRKKEVK